MSKSKFPHGETLVVRVDINVPILQDQILNDRRIRQTIPFLKELLSRDNRLIILAHQDHPRVSLQMHFERLCELLPSEIFSFEASTELQMIRQRINQLPLGEGLLLQNTRLFPEEQTSKRTALIQMVEEAADAYAFDAFDVAHRDHASLAGFKELRWIISPRTRACCERWNQLDLTKRTLILLGGSKQNDTAAYLRDLDGRFTELQVLLLGQTFLDSKLFPGPPEVNGFKHTSVFYPIDVSLENSPDKFHPWQDVNSAMYELVRDIGPRTIDLIDRLLQETDQCFVTGPPGKFEDPRFVAGTVALFRLLEQNRTIPIILAGGHTIAAAEVSKVRLEKFIIFTGGGVIKTLLAGRSSVTLRRLFASHRAREVAQVRSGQSADQPPGALPPSNQTE